MKFSVGDRVRFNPVTLASAPWRDTIWRIAALTDNLPEHGGCALARLESDDGKVEVGIRTAILIPAWDGPLDRNGPVAVPCPHCGERAQLLPPLGDRSDYRCPTCQDFSVAGTTERLFELGTADPQSAQIVTENGRRWLKPL
jgi:hypothetical protein